MARPAIANTKLNDHLTLSECHPDSECRVNNWWLYDKRAGLNIGMRAKTKDEAFVEAIEYWSERAIEAEQSLSELSSKVNAFLSQFNDEDDEEIY